MIRLNGVELDPNLQIPNLSISPRVAGSDRPSVTGVMISQRLGVPGARELQLTARREGSRLYGRFLHSQIVAIRLLAESGQSVELVYNGTTINVKIKLDGINVTMIGHRTDPLDSHPYTGTITLLEVL